MWEGIGIGFFVMAVIATVAVIVQVTFCVIDCVRNWKSERDLQDLVTLMMLLDSYEEEDND